MISTRAAPRHAPHHFAMLRPATQRFYFKAMTAASLRTTSPCSAPLRNATF